MITSTMKWIKETCGVLNKTSLKCYTSDWSTKEVELSKKRAESYYKTEVKYLLSGHGFQNGIYFIVTVGHLRQRLVREVF